MSEAVRKYEHFPQNDNGDDEVVTIHIGSSLTKTSQGFDKLRPKHFTESFANDAPSEDELFELDPSSPENLDEIKEYLTHLKEQIAAFTAAAVRSLSAFAAASSRFFLSSSSLPRIRSLAAYATCPFAAS